MPLQKPKPPQKSGNLGGMPKWAWIAGAAIGLIIGLYIYKKSGSSSTGSSSDQSSSPLGASDSGSGGGVVAAPPSANTPQNPALQAQGISGSSYTDPGNTDGGSGTNLGSPMQPASGIQGFLNNPFNIAAASEAAQSRAQSILNAGVYKTTTTPPVLSFYNPSPAPAPAPAPLPRHAGNISS